MSGRRLVLVRDDARTEIQYFKETAKNWEKEDTNWDLSSPFFMFLEVNSQFLLRLRFLSSYYISYLEPNEYF